MLPEAASEHYRAQQRLVVATLGLTRTAWDRMDLDDLDGSWERVAPVLLKVVASAQLGAARNGAVMVPAVLDELDQAVDPDALVSPAAFAGYASDGRPLGSLLEGAKVRAKEAQSLAAGGAWLDMVAHTMVADAARQSAGVSTFVRPKVGYVRAVSAPCCQRCAVLAGKFSRSEVAFRRHPRCDCFNVPTREGATHPGVVIGPEDVKDDLTKAQRRAIGDGADMNQVINSHRANSRSKNRLTTTEGTSVRGVAGRRLAEQGGASKQGGRYRQANRQRLTPEGIYRIASDRDEALRLLRQHGYVL